MALIQTKLDIPTYSPIVLESLRVDAVLTFDLYVKLNRQMVLYRSADLPFTEHTQRKLLENGVRTLYITGEGQEAFQVYLEDNLDEILADPTIPETRKAGILYETSRSLIVNVFENPTYGENIRRSKALVGDTISYLMNGRNAFLNLFNATSFNYTIYSHSVNVCAFSLALAQKVGISDPQILAELGIGALLHDIGKSKVSERILNKRTHLSPTEFEIIKRHPEWGLELLRETHDIPEVSYRPVLEHHERGGRRGYPHDLDLSEMHDYSKIVAIADCFDAMTTQRVYQNAMDTFPALRLMNAQKGAYDPELLRAFILLLGPDAS